MKKVLFVVALLVATKCSGAACDFDVTSSGDAFDATPSVATIELPEITALYSVADCGPEGCSVNAGPVRAVVRNVLRIRPFHRLRGRGFPLLRRVFGGCRSCN